MTKREGDRIKKETIMIKDKKKFILKENSNLPREKNLILIGTNPILKKTLIAEDMNKELKVTKKSTIVMRRNSIDKDHMIIETK